ncbi:TIGR03571 family LLM class oxidoreductase [Corynebacterium terpenotabidum]|nr:TIGR03571 family LLM class oxidoreductase [Corynebacterium terpenotabidum]
MGERPAIMQLSEASPTTLPGWTRTFAPGKLTLGLSPVTPDGDLDRQVRLTRAAEDAGVAAVWARDIPLNVETFGDVGQIHDPFLYLTWLAAHTDRIALGTAAVVLPLAHPLLLAKRSAGLDRISGGRFLMGVASGDRPEEFAAFGLDKGERGEIFREHLEVLKKGWSTRMRPVRWSRGRMGGAEVVPKPTARSVPLLAVGSCLQTTEFNASHTDGWMTYHRDLPAQKVMVDRWRASCQAQGLGFRPVSESLWIDLAEDPTYPAEGRDFGYRLGRNALLELLSSQRDLGLNHVCLSLRHGGRPVEDSLAELAEYVVPEFPALG